MKRRVTMLALILIGVGLAQVIEKPVPFDSTGKVMAITGAMREKLGLFGNEAHFLNARLWLSDQGYALEINYPDGSRRRVPLTAEQAAQLRSQVSIGLPSTFSEYRVDQSGRGLFLLNQIPIATIWYSPALLYITQPPDFASGGAIYTLGAAAFYFGPMLLTRKFAMTEAQAVSTVDYGYYGILNSFALTTLLGMGDFTMLGGGSTPNDSRIRAIIMLATSMGGQVLGYDLGKNFKLGQARYATLLTDCAIGDGALLGTFTQSLFRPGTTSGFSKVNSALMIAGTAAGIWGSRRLARQREWTEGQVTAIGTASFGGPLILEGLYFTVTPTSVRNSDFALSYYAGLALAGNVGGTYLAQRMIRETPITNSAGYIALGTTLGGGLVGAGLGFLIYSTNQNNEEAVRWITGFATGGLAGGYVLGIKLAKDVTAASQSQGARRINLDVAALGSGLVGYATRREFSAPRLISLSF